ncbi:response regulator transcription factor [Sphingomonas swuensis]|uniref:Response regulator transcription factor n=1 Tax=Sphingomonas swuensis TaxID=977800 RepID=A0ABP7TBY6_9SPHN
MTSLLIVDDHELLRGALCAYLRADPEFEVEDAEDVPSAMRAIRRHGGYDLILLDFQLPGMDGLNGVREVVGANSNRPVVLFSGTASSTIGASALRCGAVAFLSKTMPVDELKLEIRNILASGSSSWLPANQEMDAATVQLTPRQEQVLRGIQRGLSAKEIAHELDLQETTVRMTMKLLFAKLHVQHPSEVS